jgi:hypothetical protein
MPNSWGQLKAHYIKRGAWLDLAIMGTAESAEQVIQATTIQRPPRGQKDEHATKTS